MKTLGQTSLKGYNCFFREKEGSKPKKGFKEEPISAKRVTKGSERKGHHRETRHTCQVRTKP